MGTVKRGKLIRGDLAHWDGKTSTASRPDATGGTVSGLAIGNEVDVLQVYGQGTNRTRGTIADAVQRIGSSTVSLEFAPGTWTIDADLTIPSNFTCKIPAGCVFNISSGVTLTISGLAYIEYPSSWHTGSGSVVAQPKTIGGLWVETASESAYTVVNHIYTEGVPNRYATNTTPGTTDMTTAVQTAINVMYTKGGGSVKLLAETYLVGALVLKPLVSIKGDSGQAFGSVSSTIGGTIFKLAASTDAPMFQNDRTLGATLGTGIDGGNNTLVQAKIEGITFDGNSSNQNTIDADIFRLTGAWGVSIHHCAMRNVKGWGIRAYDCNVLSVKDCNLTVAPIYVEHWADSEIKDNQIGATASPIYPLLWLSGRGGSSPGTFQNIVSGNFIYNNANNAAISQPTFTADAGTDVITTSTAHGWVDETPIVCTSTGTLPAGLTSRVTYYVKYVTSTTIKLATSRANLASESYVDITDTGSGTHTIGVGENAAVYMNDDVHWITFTANRLDQNYGPGFKIVDSYENTFTANVVNGSGMSTSPINAAGFELVAATKNKFFGNEVSGTVYTSSGRTSQQYIGFLGDADSTGNIGNLASQAYDHSSADVSMAAGYKIDENHESIFLPADIFAPIAGSPVIGAIGSRRQAMLFDASADEIASAWFRTPLNWAYFTVAADGVNASSGSGDVALSVSGISVTAGDDAGAADAETSVLTSDTVGAQNVVITTDFAKVFAATPAEDYCIRFKRTGTDGGDTLANDYGLIGLVLTRSDPP